MISTKTEETPYYCWSSITFGFHQIQQWSPSSSSSVSLGGKAFTHPHTYIFWHKFCWSLIPCSFLLFPPSPSFLSVIQMISVSVDWSPSWLSRVLRSNSVLFFPCSVSYSYACPSCLHFLFYFIFFLGKAPVGSLSLVAHGRHFTLQLSIGAANLLRVELAVLRTCLWLSSSLALCCGFGSFWIPQCSGRDGAVPTLLLLLLYPSLGSLTFSGFLLF